MAKLKKKKGSYNGQVEEGQEINGSKPGALKGSPSANSMGISDRVLGYLQRIFLSYLPLLYDFPSNNGHYLK